MTDSKALIRERKGLAMDMHVTEISASTRNQLAVATRAAFTEACAGGGSLPSSLLDLPGMSGRKYRQLINVLLRSVVGPRYLEIGAWSGSTLCAATHGTAVRATVIEDWSQEGGPRDVFVGNVRAFASAEAQIVLVENDFRMVDFTDLPGHDVFLYDGPQGEDDQYDGIIYAQPALADRHVLIVSQWNQAQVRSAAWRAIRELRLVMDHVIEVRTTTDDTHPTHGFQDSDWHNGYLIAALSRP